MAATTLHVPAHVTPSDLMALVLHAIFGVEVNLTSLRSVEGIALAILLDSVDYNAGREAITDFAWAHGVNVEELDDVAQTLADYFGCPLDAAAAMRQWVFDAYSDTPEDCGKLGLFLSEHCEWVADDAALRALGYDYTADGTLWDIETPDGIPVEVEDVTVYSDAPFGYLAIFN